MTTNKVFLHKKIKYVTTINHQLTTIEDLLIRMKRHEIIVDHEYIDLIDVLNEFRYQLNNQ